MGDRVFGVVGGGGYAEYVAAHARTLARMPEGMSFTDAAAVPEAFITAWDAMVDQAGLAAGETVLVHAAGSGVGTAAIQIANGDRRESHRHRRTAEKLDRARALGLHEGVVAEGGKFAENVRKLHDRARGGRRGRARRGGLRRAGPGVPRAPGDASSSSA